MKTPACHCQECRARRRANLRLTMRLAPLLVAVAAVVGWFTLRCK